VQKRFFYTTGNYIRKFNKRYEVIVRKRRANEVNIGTGERRNKLIKKIDNTNKDPNFLLGGLFDTEKTFELLNNGITVFLSDGKAWNYSKVLKMNFIEYIISAINKLETIN
jgi:hypothetical protein